MIIIEKFILEVLRMKNYLLLLKQTILKNKGVCISDNKLSENQDLLDNNMPLCKASEIGKIIVNKCLDRGIEINTQKLHKLLVLAQIECIKDSKFPFFSENIEVWDCGVVIREVDEDFRQYGVRFYEHLDEKIILLYSEIEYIDNVINQYGDLTTEKLNQLCLNQEKFLLQNSSKVLRITNK